MLITVLATAMLLNNLLWHFLFSRAIARKPPPARPLERCPSISIIRPIRGLDVELGENLRAALDTGYPGEVETLFVFDEESDPGLPVAREVVAEHAASHRAGAARVLVAGPPPSGITGKLNAMLYACEQASGELIAFGDSDTRPDRKLLRLLVETLLTGAPRVGCTFAPVVVGGIRTAGDVGYAMMLNSLYGPAAARAAGETGELPFIMGQIMVFTREALDAIGGVGCAAGQLVDDMYIGQCVNRAGFTNVMVTHPLPIVTGGLSFDAFLKVYRRWIMFSRNGLSFAFTWPLWTIAVCFVLSLFVLGFALNAGQWLAAGLAAAVVVFQGLSADGLQQRFGGGRVPLRHAWMFWTLFLMAPFIIASMARRDLGWRGRTYQLAFTTRLRTPARPDMPRSWPPLAGQLTLARNLVQRARQRWNERRPRLR